jgi:hypothetical protein
MSISSLSYPGYHWVFPHHGTKFNAETVQKAIELFKKYEGASMRSTKGSERMILNEGLASLLSSNARKDMKGAKEPFRDYQQLFTHLGILYPHQVVEDKLRLTPVGEQLAGGRMDYPAFLFLQVFGYQYPNGASKKEHIHQMYREHAILVKPFLLIYQVLIELQRRDKVHAYLHAEEISRFLVPQQGHAGIEGIVSSILEGRKLHFGDVTRLSRPSKEGKAREQDKRLDRLTRTVSEMLEIFELLPFFDVYPREQRTSHKSVRLYVPEIERAGLSEVQVLAEIEADRESFHIFRGSTETDRLVWFEYYGSLKRKERWDQRVEQLQALLSPPPPLKLREISSATIPAAIASPQTQHAPEQTALLQQQRLEAHQQVVNQLLRRLQAAGLKVTCDPQSVDVQVVADAQSYFFEVKSLAGDQSDVVQQVREAVGQLLEYQYRAGHESDGASIRLCVVFDRFPAEDQWVILYLINQLHILVCWWDKDSQRFYFPEASLSETRLIDLLAVAGL